MTLQNDFKRQWEAIRHAVIEAVDRVGGSGWYVLGHEVEEFERELAGLFRVSHAVGVGNGMDALEIALRCLELKPNEKVLTTPLSAFASTLAILRAGGVPVYVDVDDVGNIDLEQCRQILVKDRSIRFLLPVHLFGNPVSRVGLERLGTDFQLRIIEDCAQAIGAEDDGQPVGGTGQAAGTSFYPTKNLGALGDGGALLTNDQNIATHARALRNYGQTSLYAHSRLGLNSRLDELQAAILRHALLPHLQNWTERRRRNARAYLEGITHPLLQWLVPRVGTKPVWHLFPLMTPIGKRDGFRQHLQEAGIATGVHYPSLIPDQPAMGGCRHEICFALENANRLAKCEVSLPIHPFLETDELQATIAACNSWQG